MNFLVANVTGKAPIKVWSGGAGNACFLGQVIFPDVSCWFLMLSGSANTVCVIDMFIKWFDAIYLLAKLKILLLNRGTKGNIACV